MQDLGMKMVRTIITKEGHYYKFYAGNMMLDAPSSMFPDVGDVYVGHDPQNRLGKETWLVAVMGDGTAQGDTVQKGLFWEENDAHFYAGKLADHLMIGGNGESID